jgi:hypothetical protein
MKAHSGESPVSLDAVLLDFRVEARAPNPAILDAYCKRYPQFARDLTDYALAWLIDNAMVQGEAFAEASDAAASKRLVSRAISRLYERRRERETAGPDVSRQSPVRIALNPFEGLAVDRVRAIRDELGIDTPLFAKFRNRLIDPRTVPVRFLEHFAKTLGRAVDDLVEYLSLPSMVSAAADYKAERKPSVGARKESFEEAVRASSLAEKQKHAVLNS